MLKRMLNKNKHGGTYKISFYTNKIVIDFKILDFFWIKMQTKRKMFLEHSTHMKAQWVAVRMKLNL